MIKDKSLKKELNKIETVEKARIESRMYSGRVLARKSIVAALCFGLAGSMTGCGGSDSARNADMTVVSAAEADEETVDEITDVITGSLGIGASDAGDAQKEETVYVIAGADGAVKDTIVSEWLKNPEKKDKLEDVSKLSDIENVKGDETYDSDKTKLTWDAAGNDIYYQGHTSDAAPVSVDVTYTLDGKKVSPDELLGKSGHLVIRYDYKNNSKSGDVAVPFVMATGMLLDMNTFSNINVENGKLISDGSRYIVVGYGMPGLSDSLELSKLELTDFELPDYFEIEADVTDAELGMSVTVASVEDITGSDEDIDISELEDEVGSLAGEYQDGMNSLVDGIAAYTAGVSQVASGVDTLYSGADTLYNGAGSLKNGIETAASGADSLKTGLDSAYAGSQEVSDGADKLKSGAETIATGAGSVKDGATSLNDAVQAITLPDIASLASAGADADTINAIQTAAETTLGTDTSSYIGAAVSGVVTGAVSSETVGQVVDYQINGADAVANAASAAGAGQAETAASLGQTEGATAAANYAADAGGTAAAIVQSIYGEAFDPADESQAALIGTITQAIAGAYGTGYGTGYGTAYATGYGAGYAAEYQNYLTEFGQYTSALSTGFSSDTFKGAVTNVANAYAGAGSEVTLGKVGEQMSSFSTKLDELKSGTKLLADGSTSLNDGMGTLKAGTESLASGAGSLEDGLSQLDTGAGTLQSGMTELKSGSATLYEGTKTLKDGVSELKSGTDTLVSNSDALNDGAAQLETATDELVTKLNETEDGVNDFIERVNEVRAAGRDYKSFGGIRGDMTGTTKFIIKIEGISANVQ